MSNEGVISGDAGRIGFLIKGEYENTKTYDFLDVVYYDNSSYVAKKETKGNTPQENNEYWQILAKGGISGTAGVTGVKGNAENTYRTGKVNLTAANIGAVEKEEGKGLSTNDLTDELLEKIENAGTSVTGVKGSAESKYRSGDVSISKSNIGLGKVENKSASEIISEISEENIVNILGYTPADNSIYGDAIVKLGGDNADRTTMTNGSFKVWLDDTEKCYVGLGNYNGIGSADSGLILLRGGRGMDLDGSTGDINMGGSLRVSGNATFLGNVDFKDAWSGTISTNSKTITVRNGIIVGVS